MTIDIIRYILNDKEYLMKILVSIPSEVEQKIKDHQEKNYPDLTLSKMLVRIALSEIKRGEPK